MEAKDLLRYATKVKLQEQGSGGYNIGFAEISKQQLLLVQPRPEPR